MCVHICLYANTHTKHSFHIPVLRKCRSLGLWLQQASNCLHLGSKYQSSIIGTMTLRQKTESRVRSGKALGKV